MKGSLVLERAMRGDIGARDQLFAHSYDSVHGYLCRAAANDSPHVKQQTDDVAQEACMTAVRGFGRFRGASSFKTWLTGIAKKLMSEAWGREQRLVRGVGGDVEPVAHLPDRLPKPLDILIGRERASLVTRAIEGLHVDEREWINRLMDGDTFHAVATAISERQGVTQYRARHRLSGVLESLANRLPADL